MAMLCHLVLGLWCSVTGNSVLGASESVKAATTGSAHAHHHGGHDIPGGTRHGPGHASHAECPICLTVCVMALALFAVALTAPPFMIPFGRLAVALTSARCVRRGALYDSRAPPRFS